MKTEAFLIVHRGSPHPEGKALPLRQGGTLLGRAWQDTQPDICFDDPRISRNHAEIRFEDAHYVFYDLHSSKHGAEINGTLLKKGEPYVLRHNDSISLARGAAVLRFSYKADIGGTLDIIDLNERETHSVHIEDTQDVITVDDDRREVLVGGHELRPRITGNEFELISLLFKNRGRAVNHEDIIEWVWRNTPNREGITRQDVNTLVHRLRKSLGEYGRYIETIPSYGYRLD